VELEINPEIAKTPQRKRRVLIVEDQPDTRESLQTLLEMLGYKVDGADNGLEGVRKALAWEPDIMLIDIGLPLLDGFQVAQQVRNALGGRPRLIAHTAYAHTNDRERGVRAGFDAYFVKPLDLEE